MARHIFQYTGGCYIMNCISFKSAYCVLHSVLVTCKTRESTVDSGLISEAFHV